ncbi:MAG TPA: IclR family transcriptional regulator [Acidimicrobiales bacterium]|nr:IclR family transcriptional regulator [Acidimicrobiales bacterium]
MPAREPNPDRVQPLRNATADRVIDVLTLFSEEHPVVTAAEVAHRLGMARSTSYRYLQSLRTAGLLEDDPDRSGFRLGPLILHLGRIARGRPQLGPLARPFLDALSTQTGETVLLTRRSGNQVVCLERVESRSPLRISYEPGHVLPLHAGASAMVLLAWSEPADVDAVLSAGRLPRFTSATVTDPRRLRRRLAAIRAQGYAESEGEVDEGVVGVAAPVFGADGRVAAGLSVVGPALRLAGRRRRSVVSAVRGSAAEFSDLLRRAG